MEYFAVLARQGNVGRAAEALGLSPPALSVSLKRLETAMRAKLFHRTPKGIELTSTGAVLLERINKLRLAREDVLREAAALSEGRAGSLRVGTGPGLSVHMLPAACAALLTEAPAVTLEVIVADRPQLVDAIGAGDLDLAITYLPHAPGQGLAQTYLCDDEFTVYCAIDHPLARKKRVTLADVAQAEWAAPAANIDAMKVLAETFAAHGLPAPRIRIESPSIQIRHHIIASSGILGFSSRPVLRSTPQYRYAELAVKELGYRRRSGIVYRDGGYLSPAGRRFVEMLMKAAKEAGQARTG